jgi:excisionase family DNA binding protein
VTDQKRLEPPRVTVRVPDEAAAVLGVRRDYFSQHIRPELKLIRRGKLVLVRLTELDRWAAENEQRTLEGE